MNTHLLIGLDRSTRARQHILGNFVQVEREVSTAGFRLVRAGGAEGWARVGVALVRVLDAFHLISLPVADFLHSYI